MTSNKAWGFARSGALGMAAASLGLLATAGTAFAQEEAPAISSGDTAWMLTSTALVLLMTIPGLALFYGGLESLLGPPKMYKGPHSKVTPHWDPTLTPRRLGATTHRWTCRRARTPPRPSSIV